MVGYAPDITRIKGLLLVMKVHPSLPMKSSKNFKRAASSAVEHEESGTGE